MTTDLERVQEDGFELEFIEHQTPEICLAAVKANGRALQFVKQQTPEICLAAVREDGDALEYVQQQTHEICLEAVRQYHEALEFVHDQTDDIIIEAVRKNICVLQYIKNPTPRIYNMLRPILKETDENELFFQGEMLKLLEWIDKFLDNPIFCDNEQLKEIRSNAQWVTWFYTGKERK